MQVFDHIITSMKKEDTFIYRQDMIILPRDWLPILKAKLIALTDSTVSYKLLIDLQTKLNYELDEAGVDFDFKCVSHFWIIPRKPLYYTKGTFSHLYILLQYLLDITMASSYRCAR